MMATTYVLAMVMASVLLLLVSLTGASAQTHSAAAASSSSSSSPASSTTFRAALTVLRLGDLPDLTLEQKDELGIDLDVTMPSASPSLSLSFPLPASSSSSPSVSTSSSAVPETVASSVMDSVAGLSPLSHAAARSQLKKLTKPKSDTKRFTTAAAALVNTDSLAWTSALSPEPTPTSRASLASLAADVSATDVTEFERWMLDVPQSDLHMFGLGSGDADDDEDSFSSSSTGVDELAVSSSADAPNTLSSSASSDASSSASVTEESSSAISESEGSSATTSSESSSASDAITSSSASSPALSSSSAAASSSSVLAASSSGVAWSSSSVSSSLSFSSSGAGVVVVAPSSLVLSTSAAVVVTGTAVSITVVSVSGSLPMTYTVSPSLPAGLALSNSGSISGAASAVAAAHSYRVTATNAAGSTSANVSLTVISHSSTAQPPTSFSYAASSAQYVINVKVLNAPSVAGAAPFTYSVSPALPAGLTLSSTTGFLKGTPVAYSSSASYTVTVTNAHGSATAVLSLAVVAAPPTRFNYTANPAGLLVDRAFTNRARLTGTPPFVFSILSGALPTGLQLNASTGAIVGAAQAATTGSVVIEARNSGGSTTATLVYAATLEAQPPTVSYDVSAVLYPPSSAATVLTPTVTGSAPIIFAVSPVLPTGLVLDTASGVITGVPAEAVSARVYTITATNEVTTFMPVTATLTITATQLPPSSMVFGARFAAYVVGDSVENVPVLTPALGSTAAGTYVFETLTTLPTGLTLDSATGAIRGVVTESSTPRLYSIVVSNSQGSLVSTVSIRVSADNSSSPSTFTTQLALTGLTVATFTHDMRSKLLAEFSAQVGIDVSQLAIGAIFELSAHGFSAQGASNGIARRFRTQATALNVQITVSGNDAEGAGLYILSQQESGDFSLPTFGAVSIAVADPIEVSTGSSSDLVSSSSSGSDSSGSDASSTGDAQSVAAGDPAAPSDGFVQSTVGIVVIVVGAVVVLVALACIITYCRRRNGTAAEGLFRPTSESERFAKKGAGGDLSMAFDVAAASDAYGGRYVAGHRRGNTTAMGSGGGVVEMTDVSVAEVHVHAPLPAPVAEEEVAMFNL